MKVTLDTNILLAIAFPGSDFHWVFEQLREGRYTLVVSTDILEEYAELAGQWAGKAFADALLTEIISLPNVLQTSPAYFWQLIDVDPDDNKFTDAYLSGNANLLVSNDGHYKAIFKHDFPVINWMKFDAFMAFLNVETLKLQRDPRKKKKSP